ncbi:transglutaminase domain-containing protein [Engelhardtia mirabilis]|uniref:transglutaminase domain-containing protein n=1 Tax=Engelhardtia mirabilis TaxID=2528011 RepID=UPI003AF38AAB
MPLTELGRARRTGGVLWRVERYLASHRWHGWSLATVERRCRSPHRVLDYMQTCFEYVHDQVLHGVEEFWQTPEQTHALRQGDCEDWALYACHVLRRAGHGARVFAAFDRNEGHASCLVPWKKQWVRLGTRGLIELDVGPTSAEVEVARAAAESFYPGRWECCSFVEEFGLGPLSRLGTRALEPRYQWILPSGSEGGAPG